MGMSFLIASCLYVVCNLMLRMKRATSLTVLIVVTTIIGGIYKYLEIASEGMLHTDYNLGFILKITGCYTSMSQNTSGLLAAILLIEYLYHALAPLSLLSTAAAPSRLFRRRIIAPRA
jgi:hypothetical protein